ncbi:MAG: hypothetical protein ACE5GE_01495 [Phycisphaerae bacterium]
MFQTANYLEAALWCVIGLGCAFVGRHRAGRVRRRLFMAVPLFLLFGLSDVVEVYTGAWWHPWWLLVWKACCIAGLLALLACKRRRPPD